jgi:TctA family transporter
LDALSPLVHGFGVALTASNLLWALIGVTLGTAVGVLPGIGPALTVAMLLPATGKLDPVGAFIMFGGIYYGAMYGSSTTSILLNTPGENSSVVRSRPPRSARSSPAPLRPLRWRCSPRWWCGLRCNSGPPTILR